MSEVQDIFDLKQRVVQQSFDKFIAKDTYFWDRYQEFESALWEEGRSSLEDYAIVAMAERATAAAKAQSSNERQPGPAVDPLAGNRDFPANPIFKNPFPDTKANDSRADPPHNSGSQPHEEADPPVAPGNLIDLRDANPLRWFEEWDLGVLSEPQRKHVKAGLRLLHAEFLRPRPGDSVEGGLIDRAFRLVAEQLFEVGALTEEVLESRIPRIVSDLGHQRLLVFR